HGSALGEEGVGAGLGTTDDGDAADYTTPEAVADLLVQHPRLMERPVLVRGGVAIIGRPKSRADAFLAQG
ncbi:MAG: arsenate reductase, partial [Actinomycetales bacterium]